MPVGNKIKELRQREGLSRTALAQKLGMPHTTLRNYENDEREPGHEFLVAIAKEFNVTVDYLLGLERADSRSAENNSVHYKNSASYDDIKLDDIEFALHGEVRELSDEDKSELLRMARRMRELEELKREKNK